MNIETSTIKKKTNSFQVKNVEDMYIVVDAKQVEEILEHVIGVEEDEVVILLATIKKNRIIATSDKSMKYTKINDELATRAIIELLACYPITTLISIFEEIKYYQIKEILESDAPIRKLDEYL